MPLQILAKLAFRLQSRCFIAGIGQNGTSPNIIISGHSHDGFFCETERTESSNPFSAILNSIIWFKIKSNRISRRFIDLNKDPLNVDLLYNAVLFQRVFWGLFKRVIFRLKQLYPKIVFNRLKKKLLEVVRCQEIFSAIYFQSMYRSNILMYGGVNLKCPKTNWWLYRTKNEKADRWLSQ